MIWLKVQKTLGRKPRVFTADFTFCSAAASNYLHSRTNCTKKTPASEDKTVKWKVLLMLHHYSLVPCATSVLCVEKPGALGFNINFVYELCEAHSDEANCPKSKKKFGSKIRKSTSILSTNTLPKPRECTHNKIRTWINIWKLIERVVQELKKYWVTLLFTHICFSDSHI